MLTSSHLFAVCQIGAERALKAEVARLGRDLASGFARPGLVTFRSPEPLPADVELELVFARAYGISFGPKKTLAEALEVMREPARLHVFPRDLAPPGDDADRLPGREDAERVEAELRAKRSFAEGAPRDGELVFDVVVAEGEPLLVGAHVHGPTHVPEAGGRPMIAVPDAAPSRAYAKLVEALAWSGIQIRPGRWVVEVGAAPGGSVLALLERGAKVLAIDPRPLDGSVIDRGARPLRKRVEGLVPEDFPRDVDLVTLDIGAAPQFALHHLRRVVSWTRPAAVILTLKLNEWSFADEIPAFADKVRAMGFRDVRVRQLASNRQEVCLIAR